MRLAGAFRKMGESPMGDNPNYPIGTAAVNWLDSSNQLHIRVYSTDGYTVTERCFDGSGPDDRRLQRAWIRRIGDRMDRLGRQSYPRLCHQ